MNDLIRGVISDAQRWPEKYQPGARRFANELLGRLEWEQEPPPKRFLKVREYAKRFGMEVTEVRTMCENGTIPGATRPGIGSHWVIDMYEDPSFKK